MKYKEKKRERGWLPFTPQRKGEVHVHDEFRCVGFFPFSWRISAGLVLRLRSFEVAARIIDGLREEMRYGIL